MPTKRSDLTTNLVASLALHTKRINGETVASPHYFLPAYVSVPKVQEEDKPRKMSQILTVWSDMLEKKMPKQSEPLDFHQHQKAIFAQI
jgi:hypothetical protein